MVSELDVIVHVAPPISVAVKNRYGSRVGMTEGFSVGSCDGGGDGTAVGAMVGEWKPTGIPCQTKSP